MKTFRVVLGLLLIIGAGSLIWGGVDGQWVVPVRGSNIGMILEFQSDGRRLTGSLQGPNGQLEMANGSVDGDRISFEVVAKAENRTVTVMYRGRIHGDSIDFEVESAGVPRQTFTANRRPANAGPPDWFAESPAPSEVSAWLKASAIPLTSLQPDSSFADLEPFVARLKDVRLIAMGEATHGTREFQQFKVRMFEFLAQRWGLQCSASRGTGQRRWRSTTMCFPGGATSMQHYRSRVSGGRRRRSGI